MLNDVKPAVKKPFNYCTIQKVFISLHYQNKRTNNLIIMEYVYCEDMAEFIAENGLGYHHSAKTIDKHLEDDDLMAIVFYIKECWGDRLEDDLYEEDVAEVVCDFVNCASDDFGWKYGTFSRYSWCGTFEKIMELCGIY